MDKIIQLEHHRAILMEQMEVLDSLRNELIENGPDADTPLDDMYYTMELQDIDAHLEDLDTEIQELTGNLMELYTEELQREYEGSVL